MINIIINRFLIAVPSVLLLMTVLVFIPGCVDEHNLVNPEDPFSDRGFAFQKAVEEYKAERLGISTMRQYGVNAMNNKGQVVGVDIDQNAFVWDVENEMSPLQPPGGAERCMAFDINSDGDIVGRCREIESDKLIPVIWQGGNPTTLEYNGYEGGAAMGINDAGAIVGYVRVPEEPIFLTRAVYWANSTTSPVGLSHYDEVDEDITHVSSGAISINNMGYIVGGINELADDGDDVGYSRLVVWKDSNSPEPDAELDSWASPTTEGDEAEGSRINFSSTNVMRLNNDGDILAIGWSKEILDRPRPYVAVWFYTGSEWYGGPGDTDIEEIRHWSIFMGMDISDRENYKAYFTGIIEKDGSTRRAALWTINTENRMINPADDLPLPDGLHHRHGESSGAAINFVNDNNGLWIAGSSEDHRSSRQATLWRPVVDDDPDDDPPSDPEPGDGEKLFVDNIDHREQGPHLRVTITVVDEYDQPVGGVSVEAETTNNNGENFSAAGTTDSDGMFTYRWQRGGGDGPYETCVKDLDLEGYEWEQGQYCQMGL